MTNIVQHPSDESLLKELKRLLALAKDHFSKSNFGKSLRFCDTAIDIMTANKYCADATALQKMQEDFHFERAMAHVRRGSHAEAAEDLSKVLRTDPERDTAHAYRASELADLGLLTLAIDDYTTAIRLNSTDPANYFNRAQCYLILNSPQRASRDLTAYIALIPDDPDAYYERGGAYFRQQKWGKAQADLRHCLELDSGHQGASDLLRRTTSAIQTSKASNGSASPVGRRPTTLAKLKCEDSIGTTVAPNSPASPSVRFGSVFIREHSREIGASGGVPHDDGDGYALGITDEHVDRKPLHIEVRHLFVAGRSRGYCR